MSAIFMKFPGGIKKALTLSYDDGVEQDVRLLSIMQKHGIKGTFNLNSGLYGQEGKHSRMSRSKTTETFAGSGMEIAVHGFMHASLSQLPVNLCTMEVAEDRLHLEEQFHRLVRGMAYANGSYDESVIECLKCCGIAYARTTISTRDFRLPSDWYRLTPTCHHKDEQLMELAHKFVEEKDRKEARLFYLWGHSYEFEEDNNWERIEHFAEYMGGRKDIWYATNIEIHDYVEAFREMLFGMDGSMVYNRTIHTLYFERDGENWQIAPGETIEFARRKEGI